MSSQEIQPNDLVAVMYLEGRHYNAVVKPGAVGIVLCIGSSPSFDPFGKYWSVSFPGGIYEVHQDVLRKIDGDGRNVGRWDYCVFNAPKRAPELERQSKVMEHR
jgi:hypothetical protein